MIREVMVFSSVIITVGLLTQSHMRIRLMDWLYSPFNKIITVTSRCLNTSKYFIISGGFTTGWL